MQPKRLSSHSPGYRPGNLSIFPKAIDSENTLFRASNNVQTKVRNHISLASKYIIAEDASAFPETGLLRLSDPAGGNAEIVFYGRKIGNQFHWLQRAYGGTAHGNWPIDSIISLPVMAEHHNALKDAVLKIQEKIGHVNPEPDSLHGIIRSLEQRWLTPKSSFKAYPTIAATGTNIRFQNFSIGHKLRYLWDFGDGSTSTEKSPFHTYKNEGFYTVRLNVLSDTKAQGFTEKTNYIQIINEQRKPLFYGRPLSGYSANTDTPTDFELIDQTDGSVISRHWFFGDGTDMLIVNPNIHTIKHKYLQPGTYTPSLIIKFADEQTARAIILEPIMVF